MNLILNHFVLNEKIIINNRNCIKNYIVLQQLEKHYKIISVIDSHNYLTSLLSVSGKLSASGAVSEAASLSFFLKKS